MEGKVSGRMRTSSIHFNSAPPPPENHNALELLMSGDELDIKIPAFKDYK